MVDRRKHRLPDERLTSRQVLPVRVGPVERDLGFVVVFQRIKARGSVGKGPLQGLADVHPWGSEQSDFQPWLRHGWLGGTI
nr:MAG: hypothetical protein H1Bulk28FD740_000001 [Mitovirus sp.]